MFLANFTFDTERPNESVTSVFGAAGQRWVTGFGGYTGATAVLDAELTAGGVFNSVTPAVDQTQGYGTYTVTFSDCMNGTIAYEFPGQDLSGEIPITRVSPDNAALCEALQNE